MKTITIKKQNEVNQDFKTLDQQEQEASKQLQEATKTRLMLQRFIMEGMDSRTILSTGFIVELQREEERLAKIENELEEQLARLSRQQSQVYKIGQEIYKLCNEKQYYTCGTCNEYSKMFEGIRTGKSMAEDVAYDIYYHSNYIANDAIKLDNIMHEVKIIFRNSYREV